MSKITNKSVKNFLKSVFQKLRLTDNEFAAIRKVIDKAQYDCCDVITVYWADEESDTIASRATPFDYQLVIREGTGGDPIYATTDRNGPNPQVLRIPGGLAEITVQLSIFTPQSEFGGTFHVTDNLTGEVLADGDNPGNYSNAHDQLAKVYIISTKDGVIAPG